MIWTKEQDIIDNIKVGMKITWYYDGNLREDTLSEGIVSKIIRCSICNRLKKSYNTKNKWVCNKKIGINGSPPTCFSYGQDILVIKSIEENDFLTTEEFEI